MPATTPRTPGEWLIRAIDRPELPACRALAEEQLGLDAADRIPEWFVHTTDLYGGLTLGAFAGERLVGYSYALAGFDGRPFLLSCGLAVASDMQGRGVGMALKLAQAREARRMGYAVARWTTNALASRSLHLYLSKLGARLVRYREDMYAGRLLPDEVEIEWDLAGPSSPAPPRAGGAVELVPLPWDREALAPARAREWLASVRTAMCELLDAGYVGTAVRPDRSTRRSFVVFERRS